LTNHPPRRNTRGGSGAGVRDQPWRCPLDWRRV